MKTNAMRILEEKGIAYALHEYEVDENDLSGVHVAAQLCINEEQLFKTLVAKGEKNGYAVYLLPCALELDLKKAARALKDKSVQMLAMKDLKQVTGYIRGGCSPIGMKKQFPTFIDETALLFDSIYISAGLRGAMLKLSREVLTQLLEATMEDLLFI